MARKGTKRKIADMGTPMDAAAGASSGRPVVIQLVALTDGKPHPYDGQYVLRYHPGPPSFARHTCLLVVTRDAAKAKVYGGHEAAHAEWTRVDPREPVRSDGRPNRPLTAWSVLFTPAPGAVSDGPMA